MKDNVQEIKDRLNVVDVVSDYVELKKLGLNHKGLCPFHGEKTPSFVVSEEKQIWHCFGCSKGGDMFTFIQEIEGLEFRQALEVLGRKAGVEIKQISPQKRSEKQKVLTLLELAAGFFRQGYKQSTSGEIARSYVQNRNMPESLQERFMIGYSPDSFSILTSFLLKRGFKRKEIVAAGLAVQKPNGDSYDRFRNRLMFPILDAQSNVVGFGARLLEKKDDAPKYINSPETEYYNKSRVLYGLNWAKEMAREKKSIIVVEGYMDVIASHKAGVENVVASSGTALTTEQVQLMKRYVETIYLSFDMDTAGEQATRRGVDKLLEQGVDVKIITLPDGKDPDELVSENPDLWPQAIENAEPLFDHYFKKSFDGLDFNNPKEKSKVFHDLVDLISYIPDLVEKAHYAKRLAEVLSLDESMVYQALGRKGSRKPVEALPQKTQQAVNNQPKDFYTQSVEHIFAMLLMFPVLLKDTPQYIIEDAPNEDFKELALLLKKVYTEGQHESVYLFDILSRTNQDLANTAKQLILSFEHQVLPTAQNVALATVRPIFEKSISNFKKLSLKKRITALSSEMRRAEQEERFEDVERLSKIFTALTKELTQS